MDKSAHLAYDKALGAMRNQALNRPGVIPLLEGVSDLDVTLDDDPTSASGPWRNVQGLAVAGWRIVTDVTIVGAAPQATYTILGALDPDSDTGINQLFYDPAGGATPQTSEVVAADAENQLLLDCEKCLPWAKLVATGANTDVDDTVAIDAVFFGTPR